MNALRVSPRGLVSLLVLFVAVLALPAMEDAKPEDLVKQLGAPKFNERAAASQKLEALGAKALPALRAAAKDQDPEVARRAAELIALIEKQAEMDVALRPTLVELTHADAPLKAVVADLAKQAGCTIKLDKKAEGGRGITLKTGKVPFWQAFDELCKKAELTLGPVETKAADPEDELQAQINKRMKNQFPNANMIIRPPAMLLQGGTGAPPKAELTLVAGKPADAPTAYVGALRVRALPIKQAENENIREHTGLLIEVCPEPKLTWRGPLELRTDKLTDDAGQAVEVTRVELSNVPSEDGKKQVDNQALMNDDVGAKVPFNQQIVVLLRPGDKPAKLLPELKAVLVGQAQGQTLPVITIDEVAKAGTKPHKSARGDELAVASFKELDDGEVELQVELKTGTGGAGGNLQQQMVFQGNVQIQFGGNLRGGRIVGMKPMKMMGSGASEVQLYDQDGKPYAMNVTSMQTNISGGERSSKLTIRCEPPKAGSKAKKLTYESNRPTSFETPFSLKNVPLPQ